jgi:hypothetical protein
MGSGAFNSIAWVIAKGRSWPTPVISNAEIHTYRMVALWAGPECRVLSLRMAGVDPKPTLVLLSRTRSTVAIDSIRRE